MSIYWVGIPGKPTTDQRERLAAAGLVDKGVSGEAFSRTIYYTYFLVNAPSVDAVISEVEEILPELREEWERNPPHIIDVKELS